MQNRAGFVTILAVVFTAVLMVVLLLEIHGFGQQQVAFERLNHYYESQFSHYSEIRKK